MASSRPLGGLASSRLAVLSSMRLLLAGIANIPLIRAAPLRFLPATMLLADEGLPPKSPKLWIYMVVAMALVLLGGAFAGLTIALMGQDEIYLQVIKDSGEGSERKHASKVLRLLKRGKHWVLVTLLLGNVITNETLPIVLDRSLGGGWPAVLGSTALIVIFGEIIPQSICVRYGLPIGAWMSPLVLVLMYILAPVAWPTAKLLDKLLGEDHGTTYKKAGLKTLVTLHKTLGSAGEQLNSDEVTIISAVLDLKDKSVGNIMTPMDDVFTMSADTILDEKTMDIILSAGYSRIPIYQPDNPQNFVGMLLVKILITYDPEDCKRVREFALATLPETRKETSCLDIVNFFQEGKSHMVLVSEFPGEDRGALGVVTLEDVIEELIGEEIIDESDVFVDVHKAIRRIHPAPRSRVPKGEVVTEPESSAGVGQEDLIDVSEEQDKRDDEAKHRAATPDVGQADGYIDGKGRGKSAVSETGTSLKVNGLTRRTSSVTGSSDRENSKRGTGPDKWKHLGPSNLASRPRQTRYNTVKIKPGGGSLAEVAGKSHEAHETPRTLSVSTAPQGGVGEGLLNSAGKEAKDGVLAVQAGYGTMDRSPPRSPQKADTTSKGVQANKDGPVGQDSPAANGSHSNGPQRPVVDRTQSHSTIGSLPSRNGSKSPTQTRLVARSGSITENIIEAGGIKKVVLELTSSSDDTEESANGAVDERKENDKPNGENEVAKSSKKKRRRKRKKGGQGSEETPLLDREDS